MSAADWSDAPIFIPEVEQTFTPGDRVFRTSMTVGRWRKGALGTYLGYEISYGHTEVAVVEWDDGHALRRESFADIRNLGARNVNLGAERGE